MRQRQQVVVDLDAPQHRRLHPREVVRVREDEVILRLTVARCPHGRVLVAQRTHHARRCLQVLHVGRHGRVVHQVVLRYFVHAPRHLVLRITPTSEYHVRSECANEGVVLKDANHLEDLNRHKHVAVHIAIVAAVEGATCGGEKRADEGHLVTVGPHGKWCARDCTCSWK